MALSIVDKRMPGKAKEKLSSYFELMEFSSEGITYGAISGHPDIFFCMADKRLVISPDVPQSFVNILKNKKYNYTIGTTHVGDKYPGSAVYNAAITGSFLIHRTDITDKTILDASSGLEKISVRQGYTRCSLLPLKNNSFISSDHRIYKKLSETGLNVLYIKPDTVLLPGFSHGFFGGTCGVYDNTVFVAGSLSRFAEGERAAGFLRSLKYDIVELYDGPLFDCGSILIG